MDINLLTINFILILTTLSITTQTVQAGEQKGPGVRHICGKDFIRTWQILCKIKQLKRNRGRKRRSLLDDGVVKIKSAHDILDSRTARSFLKASLSVRTKRSIYSRVNTLNASEECCMEGCRLSEINEYDC